MAYDTREGLNPKTDPGAGEGMNLPPEGQTRMNIVHEGTNTTPTSHQTENTTRKPVNLVGDDKTHEQMLQWLSKDPTRLADAQKDVARWK